MFKMMGLDAATELRPDDAGAGVRASQAEVEQRRREAKEHRFVPEDMNCDCHNLSQIVAFLRIPGN